MKELNREHERIKSMEKGVTSILFRWSIKGTLSSCKVWAL